MTRVLFVCGKARMRSPTAAQVVAGWAGIEADYAGLSRDADEMLSAEQVDWADVICVMERRQKKRLGDLFGSRLKDKRVVVLGVPDDFAFMEPALVERLRPKLREVLRVGGAVPEAE